MEDLWIIHRQAARRAALERLSRGIAGRVRTGAPSDPVFDGSPVPAVVVLGLSGDLEEELEFAHRHGNRRIDARWLLLRTARLSSERVDALFGGLAASQWPASPSPAAFRAELTEALAGPGPLPLSARRRQESRERLCNRFFSDLEMAVLRHGDSASPDRMLIRGESGTGRLLLARALHARYADRHDAFVVLPCGPDIGLDALLGWAQAERGSAPGLTLCLDGVDRLDGRVQRALLGRIERGDLLAEDLGARRLRWLATCGDEDGLDGDLAAYLGTSSVWLPPLRERPAALEGFVVAAAAAWRASRGLPDVGFSPDALALLGDLPWPGNFRELECTIIRTLAQAPDDPIGAGALILDEPFGEATDAQSGSPTTPSSHPGATKPALASNPAPVLGQVDPDEDPGAAQRKGSKGPGVPTSPLNAEWLVGAVAHAVRNPLVTISTFASLLPERYEDPEFRGSFSKQVTEDVEQIESVVDRLVRFAAFGAPQLAPVDVTGVLETLLEERRPEIQERRLLVLQELDPTRPLALADEEMLRFALEGLLSRALSWVPERADLFVASKYHPLGPLGRPAVRVLLRFFNPVEGDASRGVSSDAASAVSGKATALEFVLADQLIGAQGGTLSIDSTAADETLILMDLPAPG